MSLPRVYQNLFTAFGYQFYVDVEGGSAWGIVIVLCGIFLLVLGSLIFIANVEWIKN